MSIRIRRLTLLALTVALAGCSAHRSSLSDLPVEEMAGHFTSAPGESWFRPCSASADDPSWWVTFTERSVAQVEEQHAAGRLQPGQREFVRWRAAVTRGGEVGPQGPGVPALLVREILEVRPAAAGDCPTGAPADQSGS